MEIKSHMCVKIIKQNTLEDVNVLNRSWLCKPNYLLRRNLYRERQEQLLGHHSEKFNDLQLNGIDRATLNNGVSLTSPPRTWTENASLDERNVERTLRARRNYWIRLKLPNLLLLSSRNQFVGNDRQKGNANGSTNLDKRAISISRPK